ncbi:MAG TPA: HAMP domain-containing sensor histidine kinase [Gemmatimonadaceae bacterium]|nr:HAMP domain-containing sensor histidine kinase [Gemmatimonadaceae bacterium]
MRRRAPVVVLLVVLALLLGSYVVYTRTIVRYLRADAARLSQMYARVFNALADTSVGAETAALLDVVRHITALGVPVVVTDTAGRATAVANLPFGDVPLDDPRIGAYVRQLDQRNLPVVEPGVGEVHFGDSRLVQSLRFVPVIQSALLLIVLGTGVYMLRVRGRADRERVWAGMARESAHQLATPLSSLGGWLELIEEHGENDPSIGTAMRHMRGDLDRLNRVASRFERIGRPPRQDAVDLAMLAARVADYFAARVPSLAHRVAVRTEIGEGPHIVRGDAVLIEWALEALVKNAVDALAGRGGAVVLTVERGAPDEVRLRVADDGPGVPVEHRLRIFEPGFSTKESGWGIGLSLARRIIEENHRGRIAYVAADRGATFDIILPG